MARISLSLYEQGELPVSVQDEQFAFGKVIYFTLGGFGTADMVCLHLSSSQLEDVAAAIAVYKERVRL